MWPSTGPLPPMPPMGGYLRHLFLRIRTSGGDRPQLVLRHAADRTRSRRAAAGSRRTKRYGLRAKGPRGGVVMGYDAPFNALESFNIAESPAPLRLELELPSALDAWLLKGTITDTRDGLQVLTQEVRL